MKYANQLSTILAATGVLILLYAFSQTFLAPEPQAALNLEGLRDRGRERASRLEYPAATDLPAVTASATTTASPNYEAPPSRPARTSPATVSPELGTRRIQALPRPSPAQGNQPQLPSAMPVWIGDRAQGVEIDRPSGVVAPSGVPGGAAEPGSPGYDPGRRVTGSMVRPPAGAESEKRDNATQPPNPPLRSSMPARPRQ